MGAQRITATYIRFCTIKYGYKFVLCMYTTPNDNYYKNYVRMHLFFKLSQYCKSLLNVFLKDGNNL